MKISNTYDIKDKFNDILIIDNTANIEIKKSDINETKVVCCVRKKRYAREIHVENSTLVINKKPKKWWMFLTPSIDTANITIFIPDNIIENVSIKINTGRITFSNLTIEKDVNIKVNTANTIIDNTIITGKISIKTNTGIVNFNNSDANELFIKTNTGKVGGTLLSNKAFVIKTNTGKVRIPTTFGSNKCEIISNTGSINFKIKE